MKKAFYNKFLSPEFKSIAGKRYSNFLLLILILLLSILTIGFGEGAKQYLAKKMDSPFVSFISVVIPDEDMVLSDQNTMESDDPFLFSIKYEEYKEEEDFPYDVSMDFYEYFGVNIPYEVYHSNRKFIGKNKSFTSGIVMGQKYDPIYDHIIKQDIKSDVEFNISDNVFDCNGWGCVVTEDFLKSESKLNFDNSDVSYIFYSRLIDDEYVNIPLPVQGIVSSLPDNRDIIVGSKMFKAFDDPNFFRSLLGVEDSNYFNNYLKYYIPNGNSSALQVIDELKSSFEIRELEDEKVIYNGGSIFEISIFNMEDRDYVRSKVDDFDVIEIYNYDQVQFRPDDELIEIEKLVFQFKDQDKLQKVGELNKFLKYKFKRGKRDTLLIDMSIIESKKNFDLFNRLARLLSLALIVFSIFSIVVYISNKIVSHITNNRKNIGTLKAFGLSNKGIIFIYSIISFALIASAFILAYLLSLLIGNLLVDYMAKLMGILDVESITYQSYNIIILISSFILFPTLAIYLKLRNILRKKTPGDLIYERL